jgi:hypothetical protein
MVSFIMDLASADRIPTVAAPLFMMGVKVEFHPVMLFEDLKKGIQSTLVSSIWKLKPNETSAKPYVQGQHLLLFK